MLIMDFPPRFKDRIWKRVFLILSSHFYFTHIHLLVLTSARGLATYTTLFCVLGLGFFYYYMAFNENATFWELTLTVCIIRENESSIIIHTPSNCKPKSFQKTWMCQELWQLWLEPENCSTAEFLMNFSSYFL